MILLHLIFIRLNKKSAIFSRACLRGAFEGLYDQVYLRVINPSSGEKLKSQAVQMAGASPMPLAPYGPSGSSVSIVPSFTSTRIGSPQSRHSESIRTVLPGNSQQTASDSNAHSPNHFCCPSTVNRYWVGRLLKGAKDTMPSVFG